MRYPSKDQALLPGIEQVQCACGCGEWFMRVKRGRRRLYVNETHKKRVMRAKRRERASESAIALTPKGWLYFLAKDDAELLEIWENLNPTEQEFIGFMCAKGITPREFIDTVRGLFGNSQRAWDQAEREAMARAERSR